MRKKNKRLEQRRWMSYEAAKLTAQAAGCKSRKQYLDWWAKVRPIAIPRFPYRVYLDDWVSWNDFLGVDNTFVPFEKGHYRPFWEAVRWVHKQRYKTKAEYLEAHDSGIVPKDIPKAPHTIYKDDFRGWKHWIGKDLENILMAAKENIAIFAICNISGHPGNLVQTILAKDGEADLREQCERLQLTVVKMWKWEEQLSGEVEQAFRATAHDHGGGEWLVPNLNNLLFELDTILLVHTPHTDNR